MSCGCQASAYCRAFLLGLCIFLTQQARAHSCSFSLLIDDEYRELVKIASENKARRDEIMASNKEDRKKMVQEHLLEAIRYEEKKARLYIAMLGKLLRQKETFIETTLEIRRRLIRSLDNYEQFKESLVEVEGFVPRPIDAPMSEEVALFLKNG